MSEEKKEPWMNYLALTTIIFAVCATLATFKGGGYSTRSLLSQAQESDQWSYYQSKSVKQYIHEAEKDELDLQLKRIPKTETESIDAYQNKIKQLTDKLKKYDTEKEKIKKDAEELEATKISAQAHSGVFGKGVIFLQIAILLSSIAALLKKKYLWLIGVVIGIFGVVLFVDGFFLF